MSTLSRITLQRLTQLPKTLSVWEGERRHLDSLVTGSMSDAALSDGTENDCIVWVDGSQGAVRAMSLVPSNSGYEPIVRTFIQAMEAPQGNAVPARPQKIVVRDRQLQFYLRGALQDLDITVDYVPELPLIDELFHALAQMPQLAEPELPERYEASLMEKATDLWEVAPWHLLNEQQIIAIEINAWDVTTLYVSVLGMAGVEYGLLMYRSLDSLKQFRQRVLSHERSPKQMQEAFLEQDCLFLNYELIRPAEDAPLPFPAASWMMDAPEEICPEFGNLHPLEGLRTTLADEEALVFLVAIEAFNRFFKKFYRQLESPIFPALEGRYRIPNPAPEELPKTLSVTVKTLPNVAQDLIEETSLAFAEGPDVGPDMPSLQYDLIPDGALIMMSCLSASWQKFIRLDPAVAYESPLPAGTEDNLPVILIQTSRPKAKKMIQAIRQAGGVKAICFNQGNDLISGEDFRLGLLQTVNGEFHLFAEYHMGQQPDQRMVEQWEGWQKKYGGHCGLAIAAGVTGNHKGKPQLKDICGLFETECKTPEELNLPTLQLQYALDWE